MARTQAQLARFVLTDVLGVYNPINSIPAEDDAEIDSIYTDVLAFLRDEGLAYWDADSIPNEVVRHVADIVGYYAGPGFGVAQSSLVVIENGRSMSLQDRGLMKLRRHIQKSAAKEPVRAHYF